MKNFSKIKLLFIVFVASPFYTYAWRNQQIEENVAPKEEEEFERIKERISIKIEKIINDCKKMIPTQSYAVESKEEKIYEDIPVMLKKIREKWGLSGLIAYEFSLNEFWNSFQKTAPDNYGGIQPKNANFVINALSFNTGLDVNLDVLLHDEVNEDGDNASLQSQLTVLFSSFEDKYSKNFRKILETRIQEENTLSEYDASKILRDTFVHFFFSKPQINEIFAIPNTFAELEKLFSLALDMNIQKIKDDKLDVVVQEASRNYSKVLSIVDRYKKKSLPMLVDSSVYKRDMLFNIKNSLLDLQKIFGDSSLFVFNLIEKHHLDLIEKHDPNRVNFFCVEEFFEFCLNKTKIVLRERSNNYRSVQYKKCFPYIFGWDLSSLFVGNIKNGHWIRKNFFIENHHYVGGVMEILDRFKKESFSEEQLARILKYFLNNYSFKNGQEELKRVNFLEEMYTNFFRIKTQRNLENKKNSLDILRKALVVFPELYQEKNKIIMNGLLSVFPNNNQKDFSDQERKKYEQKLFGIFRTADWEVCEEKNALKSNFVETVLKILNSDSQAQRKKEKNNKRFEIRRKISALFPENDNLFLESIHSMIDEYQISEDDAFGIIPAKAQSLIEQKKVEEKIISMFSRNELLK
ncbi:hypothetical protein [Holospora undulata]|nr:hypothetical protein [Holospora undulata]